jgi:uncharacterized SAM-binding protein YcdF (DUF218 family)
MNEARIGRYFIVLAGLVAATWLVGLLLFVAMVEAINQTAINDVNEPADAIVVLTGGSERVAAGIDLLNAHMGRKLLISGVHPGLSLDRLLNNQPVDKILRDCCIILGHTAESTLGNADETRTWMAIEDYHSLRLVTANYHMPRSLLIFHQAMPHMWIIPNPIAPDSVKLDQWWTRPGTASLLVTEYNKYLLTILHLQINRL